MHPHTVPSHAGPPSPAEQVWRTFLAALDALPPDARLLLLLHDVGGTPVEALMPLLGLSADACRERLAMAHACLQDRVHPFGETPPCP